MKKWTGQIDRPLRVWQNPRLSDDIYLHFSEVLEKVKFYAPLIKGRVLDIGAGKSPYQRFFRNAMEYIKLDNHDYPGCEIDIKADAAKKIPLKSNSIDSVVCFQVLEHLKNPQKAIDEIHRVLKKEGYCLLTTHMAAPLHGEPNDYFRFTKYGLAHLFRKFGKIEAIKANGGALLSIMQFGIWGLSEKLPGFFAIPIVTFLNFIVKRLDRLFYDQRFTINYIVVAKK